MVRPPSASSGIDLPDIFDEVEEDLRADRLRRLLLRYGGLLASAAAAVVIAVGGWQAWTWYQGRQALETAQAYVMAVKAAEQPAGPGRDTARSQFAAIAERGGAGYRTLARLREAALLAESGEAAGANALWDRIAGDGGGDPLLRDFANLQWALHNLDAADPAAVSARLRPLAVPGSPWHGLAQEAQALLALRQGQVDPARDTLRLLVQDTAVPQGVRQRASGLLEQIGPQVRSGAAKGGAGAS